MNKLLVIVLLLFNFYGVNAQKTLDSYGALIKSDSSKKNIYLCFTGHDFDEGFEFVLNVLESQELKASFFLTGDFIRSHKSLVKSIASKGHFVGAHSDKHLLYNDWNNRDSLLQSPMTIRKDISDNLNELKSLDIHPKVFMPPYEWYNRKVVEIAQELNQLTINFSPGTSSNADYTTPDLKNYKTSEVILNSIYSYEKLNGMNGFHLLIHPGTNPLRKDKLYLHLNSLIIFFKNKGYQFKNFN